MLGYGDNIKLVFTDDEVPGYTLGAADRNTVWLVKGSDLGYLDGSELLDGKYIE